MTETSSGIWTIDRVLVNGGFEIISNYSWDENIGGKLVSLGVPFPAERDGDNIIPPVLNTYYAVTYDTNNETITVSSSSSASVVTGSARQTDSEYSSTGFYTDDGEFMDYKYQFKWNATLTLANYEKVKEVGFLIGGWRYWFNNLTRDGDFTMYWLSWSNSSSVQKTYQAYADLYTGERIFGTERTVTLSYGKTGQLSSVMSEIGKELDILLEGLDQSVSADGESGKFRSAPLSR